MRRVTLTEVVRRTEQWVQARRKFREARDDLNNRASQVQLPDLLEVLSAKEKAVVEMFDRLDEGYEVCSRCMKLVSPDMQYYAHNWCRACAREYYFENKGRAQA